MNLIFFHFSQYKSSDTDFNTCNNDISGVFFWEEILQIDAFFVKSLSDIVLMQI